MADESKKGPSVLSLSIKDIDVLYTAYMSFINGGGIFIPTAREHALGEVINLLISLIDEKEKFEVRAKVVWVTPVGAQGNRAPGIGVQFQGENAVVVKNKMETYLAGKLNSDKPTHTF